MKGGARSRWRCNGGTFHGTFRCTSTIRGGGGGGPTVRNTCDPVPGLRNGGGGRGGRVIVMGVTIGAVKCSPIKMSEMAE